MKAADDDQAAERHSRMSLAARSLTYSTKRTAANRLLAVTNHIGLPVSFPHVRQAARSMASLPSTMKGIQISKTGDVDVLEWKTDLAVPTPKAGEVLVKNDFIGVNYIDNYFRSGLYPAPQLPMTLGREGAGTIVALGAGTLPASLTESARVAYLATGAYAEYTAVPATHAAALPANVDARTGASALLQGLTALTMVREGHAVKTGDWVLVHAAAGGMGLWLLQLLKAIGARAIGTASTPAKRELASKAGAEVVLEYPESFAGGAEGFVAKIKETTGGAGCVAVLDGVGKSTFDVSLECVARKGTFVSFGNASGAVPPFSIARLAAKNVKLLRPTLFNYIATRDEFESYSSELLQLVGAGKIDVAIHEVYPLQEAARAQTDMQGRGTTGKLLLKP